MQLTQLHVRQFRCLTEARLDLQPGLNLLVGANGAGKTSLIEAVHLLAYGRSFRARVRDGLIRTGASALEVYCEWEDGRNALHRAGLRHAGSEWEARLDGTAVANLSDLCARLAVVTFEPGSHDLIGAGAENRRRFLDWGLFHVEPAFVGEWRRYARALRQRNALLKKQPTPGLLAPWDRELAEAGEGLTRLRQSYMAQIQPYIASQALGFLSELGPARLTFSTGWKHRELSLADALLLNRERDIALGHTSQGPHRADWRVTFDRLQGLEALSRGQEKLTALACILGQAQDLAMAHGAWPVVCLDDLASELDLTHQQQVLQAVLESGAQVLLTGTQIPAYLELEPARISAMFHVEHGSVRRGSVA